MAYNPPPQRTLTTLEKLRGLGSRVGKGTATGFLTSFTEGTKSAIELAGGVIPDSIEKPIVGALDKATESMTYGTPEERESMSYKVGSGLGNIASLFVPSSVVGKTAQLYKYGKALKAVEAAGVAGKVAKAQNLEKLSLALKSAGFGSKSIAEANKIAKITKRIGPDSVSLAAANASARKAASATSMAFGTLLESGEAAQRARAEGADESTVYKARLAGIPVGLLEGISNSRFLRSFGAPYMKTVGDRVLTTVPKGTLGNIIKTGSEILASAGVEGLEEYAQNTAQNLISKGLYKPEQELLEGSGEAFAIGALSGGIFDVVVRGAGSAIRKGSETLGKVEPVSDESLGQQLKDVQASLMESDRTVGIMGGNTMKTFLAMSKYNLSLLKNASLEFNKAYLLKFYNERKKEIADVLNLSEEKLEDEVGKNLKGYTFDSTNKQGKPVVKKREGISQESIDKFVDDLNTNGISITGRKELPVLPSIIGENEQVATALQSIIAGPSIAQNPLKVLSEEKDSNGNPKFLNSDEFFDQNKERIKEEIDFALEKNNLRINKSKEELEAQTKFFFRELFKSEKARYQAEYTKAFQDQNPNLDPLVISAMSTIGSNPEPLTGKALTESLAAISGYFDENKEVTPEEAEETIQDYSNLSIEELLRLASIQKMLSGGNNQKTQTFATKMDSALSKFKKNIEDEYPDISITNEDEQSNFINNNEIRQQAKNILKKEFGKSFKIKKGSVLSEKDDRTLNEMVNLLLKDYVKNKVEQTQNANLENLEVKDQSIPHDLESYLDPYKKYAKSDEEKQAIKLERQKAIDQLRESSRGEIRALPQPTSKVINGKTLYYLNYKLEERIRSLQEDLVRSFPVDQINSDIALVERVYTDETQKNAALNYLNGLKQKTKTLQNELNESIKQRDKELKSNNNFGTYEALEDKKRIDRPTIAPSLSKASLSKKRPTTRKQVIPGVIYSDINYFGDRRYPTDIPSSQVVESPELILEAGIDREKIYLRAVEENDKNLMRAYAPIKGSVFERAIDLVQRTFKLSKDEQKKNVTLNRDYLITKEKGNQKLLQAIKIIYNSDKAESRRKIVLDETRKEADKTKLSRASEEQNKKAMAALRKRFIRVGKPQRDLSRAYVDSEGNFQYPLTQTLRTNPKAKKLSEEERQKRMAALLADLAERRAKEGNKAEEGNNEEEPLLPKTTVAIENIKEIRKKYANEVVPLQEYADDVSSDLLPLGMRVRYDFKISKDGIFYNKQFVIEKKSGKSSYKELRRLDVLDAETREDIQDEGVVVKKIERKLQVIEDQDLQNAINEEIVKIGKPVSVAKEPVVKPNEERLQKEANKPKEPIKTATTTAEPTTKPKPTQTTTPKQTTVQKPQAKKPDVSVMESEEAKIKADKEAKKIARQEAKTRAKQISTLKDEILRLKQESESIANEEAATLARLKAIEESRKEDEQNENAVSNDIATSVVPGTDMTGDQIIEEVSNAQQEIDNIESEEPPKTDEKKQKKKAKVRKLVRRIKIVNQSAARLDEQNQSVRDEAAGTVDPPPAVVQQVVQNAQKPKKQSKKKQGRVVPEDKGRTVLEEEKIRSKEKEIKSMFKAAYNRFERLFSNVSSNISNMFNHLRAFYGRAAEIEALFRLIPNAGKNTVQAMGNAFLFFDVDTGQFRLDRTNPKEGFAFKMVRISQLSSMNEEQKNQYFLAFGEYLLRQTAKQQVILLEQENENLPENERIEIFYRGKGSENYNENNDKHHMIRFSKEQLSDASIANETYKVAAEASGRKLKQIKDEFSEMNKALMEQNKEVLKAALVTGLISPDKYQAFSSLDYYIPFRVQQSQERPITFAGRLSDLILGSDRSMVKRNPEIFARREGGTGSLEDGLTSLSYLMDNWQDIIQSSMENKAKLFLVRRLSNVPLPEAIKRKVLLDKNKEFGGQLTEEDFESMTNRMTIEPSPDKVGKVISVAVQGEIKNYTINDPDLYKMIMKEELYTNGLRVLDTAKGWYTTLITVEPNFRIINVIQGIGQALFSSGTPIRQWPSVIRNAMTVWRLGVTSSGDITRDLGRISNERVKEIYASTVELQFAGGSFGDFVSTAIKDESVSNLTYHRNRKFNDILDYNKKSMRSDVPFDLTSVFSRGWSSFLYSSSWLEHGMRSAVYNNMKRNELYLDKVDEYNAKLNEIDGKLQSSHTLLVNEKDPEKIKERTEEFDKLLSEKQKILIDGSGFISVPISNARTVDIDFNQITLWKLQNNLFQIIPFWRSRWIATDKVTKGIIDNFVPDSVLKATKKQIEYEYKQHENKLKNKIKTLEKDSQERVELEKKLEKFKKTSSEDLVSYEESFAQRKATASTFRNIALGHIMILVLQDAIMNAMGDDYDENVPNYIRYNFFLIPIGNGKYLPIPMTFGVGAISRSLVDLGKIILEDHYKEIDPNNAIDPRSKAELLTAVLKSFMYQQQTSSESTFGMTTPVMALVDAFDSAKAKSSLTGTPYLPAQWADMEDRSAYLGDEKTYAGVVFETIGKIPGLRKKSPVEIKRWFSDYTGLVYDVFLQPLNILTDTSLPDYRNSIGDPQWMQASRALVDNAFVGTFNKAIEGKAKDEARFMGRYVDSYRKDMDEYESFINSTAEQIKNSMFQGGEGSSIYTPAYRDAKEKAIKTMIDDFDKTLSLRTIIVNGSSVNTNVQNFDLQLKSELKLIETNPFLSQAEIKTRKAQKIEEIDALKLSAVKDYARIRNEELKKDLKSEYTEEEKTRIASNLYDLAYLTALSRLNRIIK